MGAGECRIALKEWAVTVSALHRGDQILLLRKGGIREEGKTFRVLHREFLLYPTYEHQSQTLLKERYHQELQEVLSQRRDGTDVTFSHWARVEDVFELTEQEVVDRLSPHYIWTEDYAQKKLHWKPRYPLSIMLLRVHRLEKPTTLPYQAAYGGCTSWVDLAQDVPLGRLTPVLTQEEFGSKVAEVKGALELQEGQFVGEPKR